MKERFLWLGVWEGIAFLTFCSWMAVKQFGAMVLAYGACVLVVTVVMYGLLITLTAGSEQKDGELQP